MPGFEETENEIRYRIRAPNLFLDGSLNYINLQKSPPVNAVTGRLRGETKITNQEFRFPKESWALEKAKIWVEKYREKLQKMTTEVTVEFLAKGNLTIQALSFQETEFSEKSVQDWLLAKGMDLANLKSEGNSFSLKVHPETKFIKGSLRDIKMKDGLRATVGIFLKEFQKSIEKKVPDRFRLNVEDIHTIEDIDITEVTLTRAPALGKMSEFLIMKSLGNDNSGEKSEYQETVPLIKIDDEKQHVGGYVLVPNLPDYQGDIATVKTIEKAAHQFLKNLAYRRQKGSATGHEHQSFQGIGHPVESFIDKNGVHGIKGGWFLETHVVDQKVWKDVKSGEIVGYSIGGKGTRKKANIKLDAPVTKTVDPEEVGFIKKMYQFFKGEIPTVDVKDGDKIINKSNKNPKKEDEMKLELLQKFNVPASQLEELEKAGVDLEACYTAVESLAKAMKMNFSNEGLGYTTIQITSAMRGNFGTWPTMIYPGQPAGMNKSIQNQPQQPQQQQPQQPQETTEGLQAEQAKMAEVLQKAVAGYDAIGKRLEALETARGARKSIPNAPALPSPNVDNDPFNPDAWQPGDSLEMGCHEADKLMKSMGVEGKYYPEGRGR